MVPQKEVGELSVTEQEESTTKWMEGPGVDRQQQDSLQSAAQAVPLHEPLTRHAMPGMHCTAAELTAGAVGCCFHSVFWGEATLPDMGGVCARVMGPGPARPGSSETRASPSFQPAGANDLAAESAASHVCTDRFMGMTMAYACMDRHKVEEEAVQKGSLHLSHESSQVFVTTPPVGQLAAKTHKMQTSKDGHGGHLRRQTAFILQEMKTFNWALKDRLDTLSSVLTEMTVQGTQCSHHSC